MATPNPFDQFDAAPVAQANPFDQFDAEPEQPATWGRAIKNVGEAGARLVTGMGGSVLGDIAGLGTIAVNALNPMTNGADGIDPETVRSKVSNALTYQPSEANSLSSKIVDAPGKVIGGAGEYLTEQTSKLGIPYLDRVAGAIPLAAASALGVKAAKIGTFDARPYGGSATQAIPKTAPLAAATVPSTIELARAKDALYKASENAGVVIKPNSTAKAAKILQEVADAENLGKLPPKMKEAQDVLLGRVEQSKPLTLKEADKVRQLINDAKASPDAADRRLAKIAQTRYDSYLDGLGAADTLAGNAETAVAYLKEARAMHGRHKNSQMVDSIERRAAEAGEQKYTQAGEEHALRQEFGKISRNEKKRGMFTAAQQAAISKVAAPGLKANIYRNVGKMDPLRGGVPAAVATTLGGTFGAIGGPAGSITGAATVGALGHIANRLAARSTKANVTAAREALVGRGLPKAQADLADALASRGGSPAKSGTAQSASPSQGPLASRAANAGPSRTRPVAAIQADIRELTDRAQFQLANQDASSPAVRKAIADLLALQRELAATRADQ